MLLMCRPRLAWRDDIQTMNFVFNWLHFSWMLMDLLDYQTWFDPHLYFKMITILLFFLNCNTPHLQVVRVLSTKVTPLFSINHHSLDHKQWITVTWFSFLVQSTDDQQQVLINRILKKSIVRGGKKVLFGRTILMSLIERIKELVIENRIIVKSC